MAKVFAILVAVSVALTPLIVLAADADGAGGW